VVDQGGVWMQVQSDSVIECSCEIERVEIQLRATC
jgi:hypothetical protein